MCRLNQYLSILFFLVSTCQAANIPLIEHVDSGRLIDKKLLLDTKNNKQDIDVRIPDRKNIVSLKAAKIKFLFKSLELHGVNIFNKADLAKECMLHTKGLTSLKEIYKIADFITLKYRNAGFLLSQAIVPPKRVKNGRVIIRVFEGYVNKVIVEKEIFPESTSNRIYKYSQYIITSKPLTQAAIERSAILVNSVSLRHS